MTAPDTMRMVEVAGPEALWLLAGTLRGLLAYLQRNGAVIRPATRVLEYGRLIVRAPAQAETLLGRATLTYHADEIRAATSTGWMVSASGPAEVITDPHEAARYRRTLLDWAHGPHDTLVRIHPQTVAGFRLARAEA